MRVRVDRKKKVFCKTALLLSPPKAPEAEEAMPENGPDDGKRRIGAEKRGADKKNEARRAEGNAASQGERRAVARCYALLAGTPLRLAQ